MVHFVYDYKHDGRAKGRLVANGNLTETPAESVYSGVVSLKGLRIVTFLAELNGLQLWATDIGNAYLERTSEKIVFQAGPEFGDRQGHLMRVVKALYGLKSSGARCHDRLADVLRDMGCTPSKADEDIWMRRVNDHYDDICANVFVMVATVAHPDIGVSITGRESHILENGGEAFMPT